jgi:hypothetical protein
MSLGQEDYLRLQVQDQSGQYTEFLYQNKQKKLKHFNPRVYR